MMKMINTAQRGKYKGLSQFITDERNVESQIY